MEMDEASRRTIIIFFLAECTLQPSCRRFPLWADPCDLAPPSVSLGLEGGGGEGLFKADAVNEEDPERDCATQV